MALYHFSAKILSRSSRNTVGALAYRAGCKLYDEQTGHSFDYRSKPVEHVELLLPKNAPEWAVEIQQLIERDRQKGVQAWCTMVETTEKRMDAQVWREVEFALHRELTKEQNMALAREFIQDQICTRGMAAQLNFHFDVDKETGEQKPHCHVVMTMRPLEEEGLSPKLHFWILRKSQKDKKKNSSSSKRSAKREFYFPKHLAWVYFLGKQRQKYLIIRNPYIRGMIGNTSNL